MKILLSAYACEPYKGSEPSVGWNWALNLSKKHEVFVITRSNNRETIENFMQNEPNFNNIKFYYYDCNKFTNKIKKTIPYGIFIYYKLWQIGATRVAKDIVERENIDIIQHITFNEYRTPGYMSKLNKPFIWGPIGGGQYYNSIFDDFMSSKKIVCIEKTRNIINYLISKNRNIKNTIKRSSLVLVADKSTQKILPQNLNKKYTRMLETAYYHNEDFKKIYNNSKNEKIKLLWIGNIIPRKGLSILIEALKDFDKDKYELVVIGEGSELAFCKRKSIEYNIEKNIKFIGKVPYSEIAEWYKKSDIFIFTSIRDTSGNVVLEAMEYGLPVVAFNHHGVADIINNECGTLIDLYNKENILNDLKNTINEYQSQKDLIEYKGKNARKRLKELYTWNKKMEDIEEIYLNIMESNKYE